MGSDDKDSEALNDFCPLTERGANAQKLIDYFVYDMSNGRVLYDKLMSFTWRYVKNKNDREELVCKFLLDMIKGGAKTYRYRLRESNPLKDNKLIGWLYSDIRNLCISFNRPHHVKDEKNFSWFLPQEESEEYDVFETEYHQKTFKLPEEYAIEKEDIEKIRKTVPKLEKMYRDLILRSYFKKMSYKDIAKSRHLLIGTVKSRLNTAKKNLAFLLSSN